MANKIEFGLSNVHIGTVEFVDGAYKFGEPTAYKGASSLKMDANFEAQKIYADDITYYIARANQGYSNTLEMVTNDDKFMQEYFGVKKADDGGLIETSDGKQKDFYIMFQINGDEAPNKYILYNNSITNKPSSEYKTTEEGKIEAVTTSIEFDTLPLADGSNAIKGKYSKGDAGYDTLFTKAPTAPTFKTTQTQASK